MEATDDEVGLWQFPPRVRSHFDLDSFDAVRERGLEIVRTLLEGGYFEAFDMGEHEYIPWNLSPAESYRRVEQEWTALGEDPNLGNSRTWFTATDCGFKVGIALLEASDREGAQEQLRRIRKRLGVDITVT